MEVQLKNIGQVEVYDVITTFAVTAPAVGLQKLCLYAQTNDNRIDQQVIQDQFRFNPGASRNLFINGQQSRVWDEDGLLTKDGHETALTGDVLVKEVGPLRIWVFENPTTGPVLLHAARRKNLPHGDAQPQANHAPKILQNISDGRSRRGLLDSEQRRWQIHWTNEGSSWAIVEKFCTPAQLTWNWNLDDEGNWTVDDELVLSCNLIGTSLTKDQDGQSVMNTYPNTGVLDPASSIRDWLRKGRFAKGPWDEKFRGLQRPFNELTNDERTRYTTDELLEDEADGWDQVIIRSIPLLARTLEDATDWAEYLLDEQTPGYTTTDRTERILRDILEDDPFSGVSQNLVHERVLNKLLSNRSDPRLSKLLHAGDDLSAVALVSETVISQKRDENIAIHSGGSDFTEFINQLSQKMKGDIEQIWYVDRYTQNGNARKRLAKLSEVCKEVIPGVNFSLLTAHTPYTKTAEDPTLAKSEFKKKISAFCDHVRFMETDDFGFPHNRYVVIFSKKESRWWSLPEGLLIGSDLKPAMRLNENQVEPTLIKHLGRTQNNKERSS